MSENFPKPKYLGRTVKVELDLYNYATKVDLKNAAGFDTLKLLKRLIQLIDKLDKLDNVKLETTPVDLCELNDVVKDKVVKKTAYDKLLKQLMLFRLIIFAIQLKKLTITQN